MDNFHLQNTEYQNMLTKNLLNIIKDLIKL